MFQPDLRGDTAANIDCDQQQLGLRVAGPAGETNKQDANNSSSSGSMHRSLIIKGTGCANRGEATGDHDQQRETISSDSSKPSTRHQASACHASDQQQRLMQYL